MDFWTIKVYKKNILKIVHSHIKNIFRFRENHKKKSFLDKIKSWEKSLFSDLKKIIKNSLKKKSNITISDYIALNMIW